MKNYSFFNSGVKGERSDKSERKGVKTKDRSSSKSRKSKTKKVLDNDTLVNGESGRKGISERIKGLQVSRKS